MRCCLLTSSAALIVAACADPDLGQAPFYCNKGDPRCPEGYVCEGNRCVRESGPPVVDVGRGPEASSPEEGGPPLGDLPPPQPDGPLPDRPPPVIDRPPPAPDKPKPLPDQPQPLPQVEVSELMVNPGGLDSDREWVELHNLGSLPVDINGWTLADMGSDSHVINAGGPLLIPGKGYLVVGRSTNQARNGAAPVQYAYGTAFTLANTEDEVVLRNKSGTVMDSVSYSTSGTAPWTVPDGASLSLKASASGDHSSAANWCPEPNPWTTGSDKGTPGAPPGC